MPEKMPLKSEIEFSRRMLRISHDSFHFCALSKNRSLFAGFIEMYVFAEILFSDPA